MKKTEISVQPELLPYLNQAQEQYDNNVYFRKRTDYAEARKRCSVDDTMVLYTSFYGRGLCCNPYALFLYLKNDPRFQNFTHVWVLDHMDEHPIELELYQNEHNVRFVEFESQEYFEALATAKYLVNNSTELTYFAKKPEQVLINTWHGIPLKTMGFDIPGNGSTIGNTLRNFIMDDYILSPDTFTTEQMYGSAYKLNNIYEGKLIEAGYPRFDTILKTDKAEFIARLKKYGVDVDSNKTLILYAPTWKGTDFNHPDIDIRSDFAFIDCLYSYLDRDKYQILFKPHQTVYNALRENGVLQPNCIPGNIDANELLSITDILISDYSSIFFDFLVTGRPILFYIPDLEEYLESRGLYFSVDHLPGPITTSQDQIGAWLAELAADKSSYQNLFDYSKYTHAVQKFVSLGNGHCCEEIVKAIFEGCNDFVKTLRTDKPRLLFHGDTINPNGITASMLNLLNNLDYDKYDVSLLAIIPKSQRQIWSQVNENVRMLGRVGALTATLEDNARYRYCADQQIIGTDNDPHFPTEVFQMEYLRTFGDVRFDYIINFSGYSGFWCNVYATDQHALQYIWMHNDMQEEVTKVVNGGMPHEKSLPQVFKHYHDVDKIVGCSKSTMEVNREKLGTPETFSKFTYMHNMLNVERIKQSLDDQHLLTLSGHDWICIGNLNPAPVSSHMQVSVVPMPDPQKITFVTVGRLSPEKNHENLIRAFAQLIQVQPNVQLYIIGDGPLKKSLRQLITELNLTGKVILTGNLSNPFIVEKCCQCFILPSYHEGMPMVLLEARTLGLPIIVSDFSTVTDSLRENGQLVIQTDENSIYEGMLAYLQGKVPNEFPFDPYEYNQSCLREFEALLQCEGEAE